jgi:rhodanese-related sulfurtransferase
VKIIDVRTPEEYAFIGHPDTAWNIPLAFVTYQRKGGKTEYGPKWNPDFVAEVKKIAGPTDTLLVMCRMRNGWKNSAPWVYTIDPEKIILQEGASKQTQ